jgi:FkbM family methyltransferase
MRNIVLNLGNKLYYSAYPLYLRLFSLYKTIVDRSERQIFRKIVKPGMIVVDVGANIGIYTKFFSKIVGPSGKVVAFEPSSENFIYLRQNTSDLTNVHLHEAAVGDESGTVTLYISKDLNVDHRTYDTGENREQVNVQIYKLDDIFPKGSRVDILKIDVQGFEPAVIRGAERLISENADIQLVIEFWPYGLIKSNSDPVEFLNYLNNLKLEYTIIGHENMNAHEIIASTKERPEKYFNLYLNKIAN